jgi:hypothetical protein
MRFRPANIRLINRRLNLPRLLLALSSKNGKNNDNDKNNPTDSQGLTGHSIAGGVDLRSFKRAKCNMILWEEISDIQRLRFNPISFPEGDGSISTRFSSPIACSYPILENEAGLSGVSAIISKSEPIAVLIATARSLPDQMAA